MQQTITMSGAGKRTGNSRSRSRERDSKSRSRSPGKGRKPVKDRGQKPKDWSKEELLEKLKAFAQFSLDKSSGSGLLAVKDKRLMSEDYEIIIEVFTRFTEVQHVTFNKCYLTDESFVELLAGFKNLRHLKSMLMPYNMLTSATVSLIIGTYSGISRRLEALDLRDNVGVVEDDGRRLFAQFGTHIRMLNGIEISTIKNARNPVLELNDLRLKAPEMAIAVAFMSVLGNVVQEVRMSHNLLNPRCLVMLANKLKEMRNCAKVDLSFNPLTGMQGNDLSGARELATMIRTTSHLTQVNLTATRVPRDIIDNINRSLQVNRTLGNSGASGGSLFLGYVNNLIDKRAKPAPENPLKTWKPKFCVDVVFSRLNRISIRDVEVDPGDPTHEIKLKLIADTRKRFTDF